MSHFLLNDKSAPLLNCQSAPSRAVLTLVKEAKRVSPCFCLREHSHIGSEYHRQIVWVGSDLIPTIHSQGVFQFALGIYAKTRGTAIAVTINVSGGFCAG